MAQDDVAEVGRVERRCFANPWPASAYRRELRNHEQNYYVLLRALPDDVASASDNGHANGHGSTRLGEGLRVLPRLPLLPFSRRSTAPPTTPHVAGFAGMWTVFDEAHITTIGVDPLYRGRGFGELLLLALVDEAVRRGATWLTLEVRVSNHVAQDLYRKYGFVVQGTRRRYYSDNGEDAYVMWSRSLRDPAYLARIEELRRALATRLGPSVAVPAAQRSPWVGLPPYGAAGSGDHLR
ncbi:MAG TPA: ribosomal protein S18-alanine N-acetyltransferase [Thermomicrobiales bacterium]|jgi:ribosomal-protein-alanine N-acetyltransferase